MKSCVRDAWDAQYMENRLRMRLRGMNKHRGSSFDDWYRECWKTDQKYWDMQRRKAVVDKRIYYGGFKVGKDRELFEEELEQLETLYEEVIDASLNQLADMMPDFLESMKQFVALHEGIDKVKEKLYDMRYKRGDDDEQSEQEDEDE